MAKMYTLDGKLLVDKPEIRIGDKCYAVDDRKKTVQKMMKLTEGSDADTTDEVMKLLLGEKAFKEIDDMDMPWPAYQQLVTLVIAAVTGEAPETVEERFQITEGTAK